MTTISTNSSAIVLSTADTNPVTIASKVTVSSTGTAVSDASGNTAPFTIVNQGSVIGSSGIELHASGSTVTNVAGAIISGTSSGFGIRFLTGATDSTVVNSGTIRSSLHSGVAFISTTAGGVVTNNAGGLITGFTQGVYLEGGSVTNSGSITGTATTSASLGFGINLKVGTNSVTNLAGGLVSGVTDGVYGSASSTDVINNAGTITGGLRGILLENVGTVTNTGTVTGTGTTGYGIDLIAGGIVSNTGTISGVGGTAVYLGGSGTNNRLILGQGSSITGNVVGSASAFNTLELSAGASPLSGLGTQYQNFSELTVDTTGTLTGSNTLGSGLYVDGSGTLTNFGLVDESAVAGSETIANAGFINDGSVVVGSGDLLYTTAPVTTTAGDTGSISITGTGILETASTVDAAQTVTFASGATGELLLDDTADFAATIGGFNSNDTLDLDNLVYSPDATATLSGDTLTVTTDYGIANLTLSGEPAGAQFTVAADGDGGTLVVACYCPDTLILTDRGEVAIEALAIGDQVVTGAGGLEPIRWIGRRHYAGRFVASNPKVLPVCIKAGALGENTPRRDLHVSPMHAMLIDGVLVPAGLLVNGVTVTQAPRAERVEYIHIELASHDVVWAEGAAAETFVDDDSRGMFHNVGEYYALYPDAVAAPARYVAPRVEQGFALEAVRRRLADRAGLRRAG